MVTSEVYNSSYGGDRVHKYGKSGGVGNVYKSEGADGTPICFSKVKKPSFERPQKRRQKNNTELQRINCN